MKIMEKHIMIHIKILIIISAKPFSFHFFQSRTTFLSLVPDHTKHLETLHVLKLHVVDGTSPCCILVGAEECELSVIYLSRLEDSNKTVREEY